MANNKKDKLDEGVVQKGATDIIDMSEVIPDGERWLIRYFGAADIADDFISCVYKLKFGDQVLEGGILSLTGCTQEVHGNWEIIGDGVSKITIERENRTNNNKPMPCWIKAFRRS